MGWKQLSLFDDIEKVARQDAIDYVCSIIREDYYDYVEDRKKEILEGNPAGRFRTMEEFAAEQFDSWHGRDGMDGPYHSVRFFPGKVLVYERCRIRPWEFAKYQVVLEI